jgi:hypothetical protein
MVISVIDPTRKQLQSWIDKISYPHEQGVGPSLKDKELAYLAFWAGADTELEGCCEWLRLRQVTLEDHLADKLRAARRPSPKPISLKERLSKAIVEGDEKQALKLLEQLDD